jgi:hypothetical protein
MKIRRIMAVTVASGAILVAGVGLSACGSDSSSSTTQAATVAAQVTLTGEDTYLVLDPATATVLTDNEVTVSPIAPAEAAQDGIAFPIIGEQVDAATLKEGTVTHTGGLTFASGDTKVQVKDFSVNLATGVLTAMLPEGASLPLLDLDLTGAEVTDTDVGKDVKGVKGALTADAATALNNAFGVEFFTEGLAIGTLDLTMVAGDAADSTDESMDEMPATDTVTTN